MIKLEMKIYNAKFVEKHKKYQRYRAEKQINMSI